MSWFRGGSSFSRRAHQAMLMEDEEEDLLARIAIEEEELAAQESVPWWGGSVPGRAVVHRRHLEGAARLYNDYSSTPVYGHVFFRRRFRMSKELFVRIANAVDAHDDWFEQKRDGAGRLGLSSLQKMTAAIRQLAYGISGDATDEYVRIGGSTAIEALKKFVRAVVEVFKDEYLRAPTQADTERLLAVGAARGFPGMLGSIDCMHWNWKNCPKALQGQSTGHSRKPTLVLEAVASYDLWIWHAFFGMLGSLNDINVLHMSNVLSRLTDGTSPPVNYTINGNTYEMGYYLADGIYPEWATFVKPIQASRGNKCVYFGNAQSAVRKDVERAFGVLQARFAIVRGPARCWDQSTLHDIMTACIIMHNMIIEDEREGPTQEIVYDFMDELVPISRPSCRSVLHFVEATQQIRDRKKHRQLMDDLQEHLCPFMEGTRFRYVHVVPGTRSATRCMFMSCQSICTSKSRLCSTNVICIAMYRNYNGME